MKHILLLLCLSAGALALSSRHDPPQSTLETTATPPYDQWRVYRGSAGALQYSALRQIDITNVHQLQPAWTYRTGDAGERTTIECNPIIIDDLMYVTSPQLDLVALDAATGIERWRFRPPEEASGVNRGVTYWEDGQDRRIFYGAGVNLYALDAQNGQPVAAFGEGGRLDLRKHLGADPATLSITLSTPGIVYGDLLIIGSATGEGYNASPGHIRAYDVRRGELAWIFRTLPQPSTFGYDTWQWLPGENYGGANNWGGLSLDEARGVVYVATGSPTYDFYGANRLGENLFGNCVIALDATTGRRKWHYQAVHHDLWDYDLACAPTLMTIPHRGRAVEVVVQPTKMGTLIVLDRETGQPLTDTQETPAPASDVPGEQAHPTQPMQSELVIVKQGLDEDRLTNISPEAEAYARQEFAKYRNEGFFT
ncbi:MAG: PQQ-binding-like beta-propeller repeat protein, partial [Tunicatimonas sp.]